LFCLDPNIYLDTFRFILNSYFKKSDVFYIYIYIYVLSLYTPDKAYCLNVYCVTVLTTNNFLANIMAVDLMFRDPVLAFFYDPRRIKWTGHLASMEED
jgi:hypothetical protein